MSERQHFSQERNTPTFEKATSEHRTELEKNPENHETKNDRKELEKARAEAHAEAVFAKEYSTEQKQQQDSEPQSIVTKQDREQTYKQTMKQVRSELNAPERIFSKVIHAKAVEQISDTVGNTVARPNAILFGSLFAFLGVLALYFYARHVGFALSGFETIAAFVIGWIVGVLVDLVRVSFRRRG